MVWTCAVPNCARGMNGKGEKGCEKIFEKVLNIFSGAGSDHQRMTARETELTQQLAETQQALTAALRENQLLRQKVDLLVRRVFGSSSEKLDLGQLQLLQLSQAPAVAQAPVAAPRQEPRAPRTRPPKAPRLPDNLPVVEEVIDPESVKAQPENWRQIGQEVSEHLDYEPGRFLKRRTVRRTYVHRTQQDSAPVTAPRRPACRNAD